MLLFFPSVLIKIAIELRKKSEKENEKVIQKAKCRSVFASTTYNSPWAFYQSQIITATLIRFIRVFRVYESRYFRILKMEFGK